jgi:hypothetical protein
MAIIAHERGDGRPPEAAGRAALTDRHAEALRRSAVDDRVAAERAYVSVRAADPRLRPFASYQRADGLLFPILPPDGSNGLYSLRRDVDRIRPDGKPAKYEIPAGQRHRLDVHPRNRAQLPDPSAPLFVTEGVKKGDALTSAGRCAVALGGVWCFRKECIPDWDLIALMGRVVVIVFDSDAETNPHVARARDELAAFLTARGARVRILRVPAAADGTKQGIDDALGAGVDLVDLMAKNCDDWRPPGQGDDDEACPQCAERAALEQAEATVLASPKIKANRKIPYLLWLRRYWSDRTRSRHPFATEGDPDGWDVEAPVVDDEGYDRVELKHWGKSIGYGENALRDARDELITLGIFEPKYEPFELANGLERHRTLVRPKAADSLLDSFRNLAAVAQPSDWGGKREGAGRRQGYRCLEHPDARLVRVCSECKAPAVLVDLEGPPVIQLESREDVESESRPPSYVIQDEVREGSEPVIQVESQAEALRDGRCAVHHRYLSYPEQQRGACSTCERERAEGALL